MSRDPLGGDRSIFPKHVFLDRSLRVITIVGNSVDNYIERGFQNTKRMDFGPRDEHANVMILWQLYDPQKTLKTAIFN